MSGIRIDESTMIRQFVYDSLSEKKLVPVLVAQGTRQGFSEQDIISTIEQLVSEKEIYFALTAGDVYVCRSHDPIKDDQKLYSMWEFEGALKNAVAHYRQTFEGTNEFHCDKHTFNEWMASLGRYMSW